MTKSKSSLTKHPDEESERKHEAQTQANDASHDTGQLPHVTANTTVLSLLVKERL
jgi:hypothetical protein